MPYSAENRRLARAFVDETRAASSCEVCGRQPVEWHNVDHLEHSNARIAHLAALGFPVSRIQQEMDASEALCRSCHMKADGRMAALLANRPQQKGFSAPPKRCGSCGEFTKPMRRGMCRSCYDRSRTKRSA